MRRLSFLPMLDALEPLIGGAASKNDNKVARHQLEEQRHDHAMEQGRELYLTPYKYGRGLYIYLGPYKHTDRAQLQKKNYVNEMIKMPSGTTINVHLNELTYVRIIL